MANPQFFIAVLTATIVILILTQLFGVICVRLGQPRVIGEMIAGVVLGPTVFGYFLPDISGLIFLPEIKQFLYVVGNLGIAIYMFVVGLEIDSKILSKKVGRQVLLFSAATLVIPFALSMLVGCFYYDLLRGPKSGQLQFCIFLGSAFSITAFPVLARILQESRLLKTRLGSLSLMSASIHDVISWILLSYVIASASGSQTGSNGHVIIWIVVYLGVMIFLVRPLLKFLFDRVRVEHPPSLQNCLIVVTLLLLASAFVADKVGLHAVFGGFLTGVIMPRKREVIAYITVRLTDFVLVLLLPLFFAFSGLNANLIVLGSLHYFIPAALLIFFAFGSKYLVAFFTMKGMGYSWREASAIGGLINARGLMELIIANVGLAYGIISTPLYSILILVAILSTLMAMPIYKLSRLKPTLHYE